MMGHDMPMVRLFTLAFLAVANTCSAMAGDKSVTLSIEGMVCGPDPHMIRQSLRILPGVRAVSISL
jgi:hypothetical protein